LHYDREAYWRQLHQEHAGSLDAVGYPELGRGYNEITYAIRLGAAERILRRGHCDPRNLLEGAVGVGAYGALWKKLGVQRWVGLDLSEDAVERLRRRFTADVFVQFDLTTGEDGLRDAVQGELFDLVTGVDVLYHLTDEHHFAEALAALASRVTPGGALLLSDVFVDAPVQIARHVLRRPMASYEAILGPRGFALAEREPVFAILGDPVPRRGIHRADVALTVIWRLTSKLIRMVPGELRDAVGRTLARALTPIDDVLKRSGWLQGTNLELALFRRVSGFKPGVPGR
jgi:SAM-dependent methyltransferase